MRERYCTKLDVRSVWTLPDGKVVLWLGPHSSYGLVIDRHLMYSTVQKQNAVAICHWIETELGADYAKKINIFKAADIGRDTRAACLAF